MMRKSVLGVIVIVMTTFITFPVSGQNYYNREVSASHNSNTLQPSLIRLQNSFFAGIDVSVIPSFTIDDNYFTRSLVMFRIGYRASKNVVSGAVGVEFTDKMFLPLSVEYKRYLSSDKWAPFIYVQPGISWHLKGNMQSHYSTSNYPQYDTGLFFSTGVGYSITTTLNEFYFSIGYNYRDYVESVYVSWDEEVHTDKSMHGINLTIGLTF